MINNKKTIGLILFIFILIISFSIILFQKRSTKQMAVKPSLQSQINQPPISPTIDDKKVDLSQANKGQLVLETENNFPINPNQNFSLILKADIPSEDIVGFDVVFSYDDQRLEFISANSLLNSFTLIPVKKENYLRLTMAKKPQENQPTLFTQTAVIRLTFKAKKEGMSTIKILPQVDKEKTQFINNKTEIIYPLTDEIKIEVLE